MIRASLGGAAFLISAVSVLTAQSGYRSPEFGLPEAAWCRQAQEADFCEVREDSISNLSTLTIDGRQNGGVTVRAWDRADVHVRVRVTGYANNETEARSLVRDAALLTDNGRIRMDGPGNAPDRDRRNRRGHHWWNAEFEAQVPREARLTVEATNGGIVVDGVKGAIDARTTNGGVVFYNVEGDVRGEAVNGGVVIELTGSSWEGAGMDVRTQNGGVRLSLPSDYSADLEARAQNGGITVDFPLMLQGLTDFRRELRARIGAGGSPIKLATQNGGVRITRR